jgi:hypothetical protein
LLPSRRGTRPPKRPGWYPDGDSRLRYFDGALWTDLVRPRPQFVSFFAELPPPESVRRRQPAGRRRAFKVLSVLAVVLLVGGALVQLIVLSVAEGARFVPLSATSARRRADALCRQVPVALLATRSTASREELARRLSSTAAAFAVLSSESPHDSTVAMLARDWSGVAIAWSNYAAHPSAGRRASARGAMASLDEAARTGGVGYCAVFQVPLARGVLS